MQLRTDLEQSTAITEKDFKPWLRSPPRRLLLINANVIDVVTGTVLRAKSVKLKGGKIAAIFSTSEAEAASNDYEVIDCKGKYVCPGLIDSHVHICSVAGSANFLDSLRDVGPGSLLRQPYVCLQMLRRGFTSVRDCGGAFLPLKQAIADGVIPGPRLFIAGPVLSQTGGHGDLRRANDDTCCGGQKTLGRICNGPAECMAGARENLRTGSDFLKIMAGGGVASPTDHITQLQFSPEEMRAIVGCASDAGTYVTAHAYTPAAIRRCIECGVRGIEHGNLLDAPTAKLMAANGVYLTPTLITYKAMASKKWAGQLPAETAAKNAQVLDAGLEAVKLARDAGVTMCFGTDLLGALGTAQTQEFTLRSQVLPALEILRSATMNPARMNGRADSLGQITEGFEADLLLLAANPLEDIRVLDDPDCSVLAVIKEGRVYRSQFDGLQEDAEIPVVLKTGL